MGSRYLDTVRITEEIADKIYHLREVEGLTYDAIAKKVNVSRGSVGWYCLRWGYEKGGKISTRKPKAPKSYLRNGKLVKAFTSEEDTIIRCMMSKGHRYSDIAKKLGRQRNSVLGRSYTLTRKDERAGL